jgi:hypothetical protein
MSESISKTNDLNVQKVDVNFFDCDGDFNDGNSTSINKDDITKRLVQPIALNNKVATPENNVLTDKDLERYTKVDHLDEDPVIEINFGGKKYKQMYALFSFISPEGVMNCNVRALKCRGCFETEKEAHEKVKELEKIDSYFKIFVAEVGKWVEFDPPASRVEKEASTDPKYQKILDAQAKMRMNKINALVGKHKENIDIKESGKQERIKETKMSSASHSKLGKEIKSVVANNEDSKTYDSKTDDSNKNNSKKDNNKKALTQRESTADRLRRRLAEKNVKDQEKQSIEALEKTENAQIIISGDVSNLDQRYKTVSEAQNALTGKQDMMKDIDTNINKIKQLIASKRASVSR